jgi:AAA family ATP:ADP antiporter
MTKTTAIAARRGNELLASSSLPPRGGGGGGGLGGLRRALFPIDSSEMTKFLLIGSIKFFVVMALTLTRDGKDAMVVAECGAEAIAFLKVSVEREREREREKRKCRSCSDCQS